MTELGASSVGVYEGLRALASIDAAEERAASAGVVMSLMDEHVAAAVREATESVIPSKSNQLRNLMLHAADGLDFHVARERKRESYERGCTPGLLAAMVEAAVILRTVAVYVTDET